MRNTAHFFNYSISNLLVKHLGLCRKHCRNTVPEIQFQKYGYKNTVTRIRLQEYGYKSTVTKVQLQKYGYKNTITKAQL